MLVPGGTVAQAGLGGAGKTLLQKATGAVIEQSGNIVADEAAKNVTSRIIRPKGRSKGR